MFLISSHLFGISYTYFSAYSFYKERHIFLDSCSNKLGFYFILNLINFQTFSMVFASGVCKSQSKVTMEFCAFYFKASFTRMFWQLSFWRILSYCLTITNYLSFFKALLGITDHIFSAWIATVDTRNLSKPPVIKHPYFLLLNPNQILC